MFALSSSLAQMVNTKSTAEPSWGEPKVIFTYIVFLLGAAAVHHALSSDKDCSSVLTLSAGLQCLAFYILAMKVQNRRATLGVSGKMLLMYATTLCFRLSSTLWLSGYLPIDKTGDWAYQSLELASLALIIYCLRSVFVTHRGTYQQKHDSLPISIGTIVMTCMILAVAIHPNLDRLPTFDIFWTTSCYLEAFAMLPQLWMFLRIGVEVEPLTGHFVVLSTLSRTCSLAFWYRGFRDLQSGFGDFNMEGWMVMGSHILQLLFSVNALVLSGHLRKRDTLAEQQELEAQSKEGGVEKESLPALSVDLA